MTTYKASKAFSISDSKSCIPNSHRRVIFIVRKAYDLFQNAKKAFPKTNNRVTVSRLPTTTNTNTTNNEKPQITKGLIYPWR